MAVSAEQAERRAAERAAQVLADAVQRAQAAAHAGDRSAQRNGVSRPGAFPLLALAEGPAAPGAVREYAAGAQASVAAREAAAREFARLVAAAERRALPGGRVEAAPVFGPEEAPEAARLRARRPECSPVRVSRDGAAVLLPRELRAGSHGVRVARPAASRVAYGAAVAHEVAARRAAYLRHARLAEEAEERAAELALAECEAHAEDAERAARVVPAGARRAPGRERGAAARRARLAAL